MEGWKRGRDGLVCVCVGEWKEKKKVGERKKERKEEGRNFFSVSFVWCELLA